MNDRPDEPDPTAVSASEEESPEVAEVRRLLADARHTEPMPADVAARMERLIDRLGDETPAARPASREGDVIAIAPQRRRRAAALLVAAAAIVVGGVVISHNTSPSGGDAATAGSAADSADAPEQTQNFGNDASPMTPTSTKQPSGSKDLRLLDGSGRVVVRPRHFSVDALKAQAYLARESPAATRDREDCGIAGDSNDTVLPARYRNARAALVFRQPQGSSQVVFLYVCGTATPVKTTTLPAP